MGQILSIIFFLAFFLLSAPAVQAADFGLSFDGTDDYVDLGNSSSLNLGTDIEISFSVKFTGTGKMMKRPPHQDHFNAKEGGDSARQKKGHLMAPKSLIKSAKELLQSNI